MYHAHRLHLHVIRVGSAVQYILQCVGFLILLVNILILVIFSCVSQRFTCSDLSTINVISWKNNYETFDIMLTPMIGVE
jgi:hypothetical protein